MDFFPAHDPVLIFSIVMATVLIAPIFAEKLRLPGIIGLILFGIILGPHVANVLERDKTIELLGTIGLLYIMFQAGLEINLEEIKKNKHLSLIFGIMTFSIPLILGTVAGLYILKLSVPASVLLASMFSSHTLLTFPIVSKLGLSKKKSVTATIGGTIITDTLAILILAVIMALNSGDIDASFWIKLVLFSAVYAMTVIIFLPKITAWFFCRFFSESGIENYVFVITALFVSASFSHLIGLEPIIGAFFAGLILNPLIPEKSVLMNRIQFVGNSLFIPFFLISVGMLIDPIVIFTDLNAIKVSVVMIIIAFAAKEIAARFFSKVAKFSKLDRGLIFGMSVNQAAATLAVVIVGFNNGIFEEDILTGTIMMIVVTCFFGAIITQKYAKKIVINDKENVDFTSKNELERILIPIANPESVVNLMDFAFLLHPKTSHEPLYPLHIVLENENVEQSLIEGESILTKAGFRANGMQKSIVPLNKIDMNISSAIIKSVNEQRISKIVLGWNKKGQFKSSFFDTIALQLAKYCDEMIFVSKIVKPLNIMERIILIVPPFIYKQKGFLDTVKSLKKIGSEIAAEWIIVAEEQTFNAIEPNFTKQKTKIKHHYIKSWKKVISDIETIIKPNDMIIQMIARKGHIAWRLNFEQMPDLLDASFKDNNIIALYPICTVGKTFESADESDEVVDEENEMLALVPASNIMFNLPDKNPEVALEKLVENKYPDSKDVVLKNIIEVLHDYPLELTEDIVLIHIRTTIVSEYQIFMVINKDGFSIKKMQNDHRLMIVLLSPESKSTQSHLNILSRLSRLVTMQDFTKSILKADTYQEFRELMNNEQQERGD